jgi:hypothetical protein
MWRQQGIQLKFDRNQLFPELDLNGTMVTMVREEYQRRLQQIANEGNRPLTATARNFRPPQQCQGAQHRQIRQGDPAATPAEAQTA